MSLTGIGLRECYNAGSRRHRLEGGTGKAPQVSGEKDVATIGGDPAGEPSKAWTILYYSAADNDLKEYHYKDFNEIEAVGSTENMNIVLQLDGGDTCKRYYVTRDNDPEKISSPVIEDKGSLNMADPANLTDFIKFGIRNYPARHYALIIADHGDAWKGLVDNYSHHGWMTIPELGRALKEAEKETGRKPDLIGFDACSMASTEVAYEIRDLARYMVGSEEMEDGDGWSYTPLFSGKPLKELDREFKKRLNVSPADFARKVVEHAKEVQDCLPTTSAIDLSRMQDLKGAMNLFSLRMLLTDTPREMLQEMAAKTQDFSGFKDQFHFAQQIAESIEIRDNGLKDAARKVMDATSNAVIAEQHSAEYPNAHGLTAELSLQGTSSGKYQDLSFAADTLWDEAILLLGLDQPKPVQANHHALI
ncbi:MAG: hypothetical protein HYU64_21730 [Armatimonadetes bacterium]|nr:hypothetical protein [Armatimonadota bacterium]